MVVHDLLHMVEKLHKAEIVHGDLRPEMLFLGDRFVSAFEYGRVQNSHFSYSSCAAETSPLELVQSSTETSTTGPESVDL